MSTAFAFFFSAVVLLAQCGGLAHGDSSAVAVEAHGKTTQHALRGMARDNAPVTASGADWASGGCDFDGGKLCSGWTIETPQGGPKSGFRVKDGGGTPSSDTGPENGSDGWGYRSKKISGYVYYEASYPGAKESSLVSPTFDPSSNECKMTFEYNMYAKDTAQMTTLTIKSSSSAGTEALLTLTGPEKATKFSGGKRGLWEKETVSIPAGTTSVTVHGKKGTSWQGDAAVDNIKFEGCVAAPTKGPSSSSDDVAVKVSF